MGMRMLHATPSQRIAVRLEWFAVAMMAGVLVGLLLGLAGVIG
jgi:hypothetical protein